MKPPKTINFIVNGDFEMQPLNGKSSYTYSNKIPGWSSPNIKIVSNVELDHN